MLKNLYAFNAIAKRYYIWKIFEKVFFFLNLLLNELTEYFLLYIILFKIIGKLYLWKLL